MPSLQGLPSLSTEELVVYSIGHSNHPIERFLELLQAHGITAVVDVRTNPHSRFVPQYNAGPLRAALAESGCEYAALPSLGGKPEDPTLQQPDGSPDIALSVSFQVGIEEMLAHARTHRIAMLCAEADPNQCHRERLIAPALRAKQVLVRHILPDGALAPPPVQATFEF